MSRVHRLAFFLCVIPVTTQALEISLPTENNALLRGKEAEFFQPTVEGTIESGMFGCRRIGGRRFHEGIDIKCLQRDHRGEPADPVFAVADGEVAFINKKSGLSNYGRYIILQHQWDGVEVFTLYAHLRQTEDALVAGQPVRRGQRIATLGHSTNTREGIPAERAHLHFEIDHMLNPNFWIWYPKRDPQAPPFGNFNGRNLVGIDPAAFFRTYAADPKLNFAEYISKQPVAFTVLVSARPFPWLTQHREQLRPTGATAVAYEISFTSWGLPLAVWPRNTLEPKRTPALRAVNEADLLHTNCCGLVKRGRRGWELTDKGREWIESLTYTAVTR
jgi:murein DD-endopeptidase MepM/ murein hydrolase activator NlpD